MVVCESRTDVNVLVTRIQISVIATAARLRYSDCATLGTEVLAPEEQHVYSSQIPEVSRSVRSGM